MAVNRMLMSLFLQLGRGVAEKTRERRICAVPLPLLGVHVRLSNRLVRAIGLVFALYVRPGRSTPV